MRIAFLLPSRSRVPIGGFIVVYEYANRLAAKGHEVSVVHPRTIAPPAGVRERAKADLWVRRYRRRPERLAPWFRLSPGVRLLAIRHPGDGELPEVDALVATTWQTTGAVLAATAERGGGFYFVQGYELDGAPEVMATWALPLHKIVIARWLEEIAVEMGEGPRTSYVPNGTDLEQWGIDVPIERRPPRVGALLSPGKGREEIVAALRMARARKPDLLAAAFGTGPPPADLPDWVEYSRLPSPDRLRALYNSCSVFVQASPNEGWGLPATESMACGCALVTCDNGGSREYAEDRRTALVVEPTPQALSDATIELAGDPGLRIELARRGRERVAGFSWPRSADEFERVLAGARAGGNVAR